VAKAQEFTTFQDGQTRHGRSTWCRASASWSADCRSLARFELRGIPPMAAGAARIRVTFQVDADGLLSVSARRAGSSGVEARVVVKPSYGLGDDQMAQMLQDGFATRRGRHGSARALREAQRRCRAHAAGHAHAALAADGDAARRRRAPDIDGLMVASAHSAQAAARTLDAIEARPRSPGRRAPRPLPPRA